MADPIRLYAEFTDDLGTDYRLNIHDANFTGTAGTFKLGADGFVLRYTGNNEERLQGVIASEVTFTLTEETSIHTDFMDLLSTTAEQRFSVSIRKKPDTINTIYWRGVLYPEQVTRPYDYQPIQNTLTAADDLGNLQYVKHDSTGNVDVPTLLLQCLNRTRGTHLWDTDAFLYYVNDFKAVDYTGTNQLDDTLISNLSLGNPDSNGVNQYYTTIEILESITKVFNARLFQSEGVWWFLPLGAQQYSTTIDAHAIQKSGAYITEEEFEADRPFSTTLQRLNGYEYSNLVPIKEVRRTRRYNGNYPLIYDNLFVKAEFGNTLEDTDVDYTQGTQFLISGTFNYAYDGDGVAAGDERVARVMLRFFVEVGSLHLEREANFDGTALEFGIGSLDESPLEYTSHTYDTAQWTTNQLHYEEVSYIFDRKDGGEITMPIVITTPPLPSDQTGMDLTVSIVGIDEDGNNDSNLVTPAGADFEIVVLRADLLGDNALGDEVTFTATNSDDARGEIDQGLCLFGDGETLNADGVIQVIEGISAGPVTQWQSLMYTGTGLGINRLGVQEILSGQRVATPIQRGTVYGSTLQMWEVLDDTAGNYALFQFTYTARSVETQLEAFLITRDATTVTTGFEDAINVNDPITHNPSLGASGATEALNRALLIGLPRYGARMQQRVTAVTNRSGSTYSVQDSDYMIMNTWAGANGSGAIFLPTVDESEGRTIEFHSDDTISANKSVTLQLSEQGVTIDGATSYDFDRAYDGITILCHGSNWYIIQKKEK